MPAASEDRACVVRPRRRNRRAADRARNPLMRRSSCSRDAVAPVCVAGLCQPEGRGTRAGACLSGCSGIGPKRYLRLRASQLARRSSCPRNSVRREPRSHQVAMAVGSGRLAGRGPYRQAFGERPIGYRCAGHARADPRSLRVCGALRRSPPAALSARPSWRYVLEGSVQRGGNRIRVNVQLIEAGSGAHIWPSGSTAPSPISWTCRTTSYPGWRVSSMSS